MDQHVTKMLDTNADVLVMWEVSSPKQLLFLFNSLSALLS